MSEENSDQPRPCVDGGVELKGLGRLSGSLVFDQDGKALPFIRDIEYVHRAGEIPLIRVTCFPSRVNALGKIEMITVCPSCGTRREGEAKDATCVGEEWRRSLISRMPGESSAG